MESKQRLDLFQEIISCAHDLYFSTYDTDFSLVKTNCDDYGIIGLLFQSVISDLPKQKTAPILISSGIGFSWVVQGELKETGEDWRYHVIGPVVATQIDLEKAKNSIFKKHGVGRDVRLTMDEVFSRIPSVPVTRLLEYALMLHFCVSGEKLTISDVDYAESHGVSKRQHREATENPHGTWLMEQKLMKLIEDGNLNFRREASRLVTGAVPADLGGGDVMRHYKNLVIAFIANCTRAAMRGGLNPETAYTLSDKYIRDVELCDTISELVSLNETMQEDFVHRVHQSKTGLLSAHIQKLCDYIDIHIEEDLTLPDMAEIIGYSPTWLSSKFHKETGLTVSQYISNRKIERAKLLLQESCGSIQDISYQLNFKTPSHFSAVFRKQTGITPQQFRDHPTSHNNEKKNID